MRIAVVGLWHLGCVTAACLATAGHDVIAIDENPDVILNLRRGKVPVEEPGLSDLIREQAAAGRLEFSSRTGDVAGRDVVWIAFDTPVDENDVADVEYVVKRAAALLPAMAEGAVMLVSSQLPAGSIRRLERIYSDLAFEKGIRFAYAPENLRLGQAIQVFTKPDRVVVGVRSIEDKQRLAPVWAPLTDRIEWMSVESAEMTKHAINAFLATSVTFINEIARICEQVGADAGEVERGLKTDLRIGSRSYLHPGTAFAGGTLARDVMFLRHLASANGIDPAMLDGVSESNAIHQQWIKARLHQCFPELKGKTVSILGLTYKPGTNTLRRSLAIETSEWLLSKGAFVKAFDPAVRERTAEIADQIEIAESPERALSGADALLVMTPWPEFRAIPADLVARQMRTAIVLDPARHLEESISRDRRVRYYSVGRTA